MLRPNAKDSAVCRPLTTGLCSRPRLEGVSCSAARDSLWLAPATAPEPPRLGSLAGRSAFVRPPAAAASSLRVVDSSAKGRGPTARIFGFDPREGLYSCSGTSLNTPSGSIVLTAGHCVLENGRWGRHIVFVPGYEGKNARSEPS